MKQTLYTLLILAFCTAAKAQDIDSNAMRIPATLQVRDWYKIESFIANKAEYELMYDNLKTKLRASTAGPTSTVNLKVDSVTVRHIYGIANFIRQQPYSDAFWYFNRINTAIRAIPNAYLQRRLDELDAVYQDQYEATLQREYLRLRSPL